MAYIHIRPVEIGTLGLVAKSTTSLWFSFTVALKKLSEDAERASQWLWLQWLQETCGGGSGTPHTTVESSGYVLV